MLALAVTSCQKTEDLAGNTGNQADVRIAVNLPAEMNAVRSQENPGIGDMVNRCIMEIYLDGELSRFSTPHSTAAATTSVTPSSQ